MLNNCHAKVTDNVQADRFREYINKVKEKLCVTTQRGVRSDVCLIIRKYRTHEMYQTKCLNYKFSTGTLFQQTNPIRNIKS